MMHCMRGGTGARQWRSDRFLCPDLSVFAHMLHVQMAGDEAVNRRSAMAAAAGMYRVCVFDGVCVCERTRTHLPGKMEAHTNMHAHIHAYIRMNRNTYLHTHTYILTHTHTHTHTHTALAFVLRQPAPVLAVGATTATFKINTLEGVKGDVVFELYPDKVRTCCVHECIRTCCVYQ